VPPVPKRHVKRPDKESAVKFKNVFAAAGVAAALAVGVAPAATAAPATATPNSLPYACTYNSPVVDYGISMGTRINPGTAYCDINGYELVQQYDGNLVIYASGGPLWSSNTYNHSGAYATFQTDGNLVVYASPGNPLWSTNTSGHPNATLDFTYGDLQIKDGGTYLWVS
jgi:hypothetical protein